MESQTKNCQNCKKEFIIGSEDLGFYERLKVPAPTWCPECRFKRRLVFRNESTLYHRKCDLCGKNIISIYDSEVSFPVYCNSCWYSDGWDEAKYALDVDVAKPFLSQFRDLLDSVPRLSLIQVKNTNCDFTNFTAESKNCYLGASIIWCEDCAYSSRAFKSRLVFDCLDVTKCEECYECVRCDQCTQTTHSDFSEGLVDSHYCFDCKGLTNCFGCVGLRNKAYCFLNQPLSKEEYISRVETVRNDKEEREKFLEEYKKLLNSFPRKYAQIIKSTLCSGDYITNSKNCSNSFFIKDMEDSKFIFNASNMKNSGDASWDDNSELDYEVISGEHNYSSKLSPFCWYSQYLEYCSFCIDSKNLFGCVGARKKEFCILNKKYEQKEFEQMRERIIQRMNDQPYVDQAERKYAYGEFLPPEISVFAYNETVAQELYPLNRDSAAAQGFRWREPEKKIYGITIQGEVVPNIKDLDEKILGETIGCVHKGECEHGCTLAFKIIPSELQFYKKMNIAIPSLCPGCRRFGRLGKRNPLRVWDRKCMCEGVGSGEYRNTAKHIHGEGRCPNVFQTSYSPDRQEIVYCENCYNAEVT